jgi:methylglutaconyl-CoA hydratase
MKSYSTILVADNGLVRAITLNRPDRRNAMTPEMQLELLAALEDAASGPCRVLVLSGAGNAFCSGLDLTAFEEIRDKTLSEHRVDAERIARLFLALYELPIPTIAAVHGPAIAGGAGLATICDFALATHRAKFGFTEVRIGFVPALVSAFLALKIGQRHSTDLLFTGRLIDADEAFRIGLVNELVQPGRLAQSVESLAESIVANSPRALSTTKRLIIAQNKDWLNAAIIAAIEASAEARTAPDFHEGLAAFFAKRKPAWPK